MSAYFTVYCDDDSACDASHLTAEDDFWYASKDAQRAGWITDESALRHYCPKHADENRNVDTTYDGSGPTSSPLRTS